MNPKPDDYQAKLERLVDQYDIPVEGSLGLIALGADGIMAWRAAKKKAKEAQKQEDEKE